MTKKIAKIWLLVALAIMLFAAMEVDSKGMGSKTNAPDLFGIYTSTVDGRDMKMIISDPYRQMTHARISPDKQWITFTRFNKRGRNGLAEERNRIYMETEIMIVRMDGTDLQSIVLPRQRIVSANSYWMPDGKGLIFVTNDNSKGVKELHHIDIATRKITRVPVPEHLSPSDPHPLGDQIVFPSYDEKNKKNVLWMMKKDGTESRQVTDPVVPPTEKTGEKTLHSWQYGDFDPKISPDGSKIAFWRHLPGGKLNWHMFVLDLKTGQEKDVSPVQTFDAMPEWSSDGKLLTFFHITPKDIQKTGLYVVRTDGTGRKKIPLPIAYLYSQPSFVPGEGSGSDARIIFSAKKIPELEKRKGKQRKGPFQKLRQRRQK